MLGTEVLCSIQTSADPTHHTPEDESSPLRETTPEANGQGARCHIPLDAGRMLLDVSFTSLRPPRAKATHIFSHAYSTEGMEDNRHDHLSLSADSQVVKSTSATTYHLPHIQSVHRLRISRKSSRCSPYVSSCWRYEIQSQLRSSPTFTHPASDGPEQSLASSRPAAVQPPHPSSSPYLGAAIRDDAALYCYSIDDSLGENSVALAADSLQRFRRESKTRWVHGGAEGRVVMRRSRALLNSYFCLFFLFNRNHIDSARCAFLVRVRGDKDCGEEWLAGIKNLDIVSCVDI